MEETIHIDERSVVEALRWINGEDTSTPAVVIRDTIDRMGKEFRRRFLQMAPSGLPPRVHPVLMNLLPSISGLCPEASILQRSENVAEIKREVSAMRKDSITIINAISHVARTVGEEISPSRAQMILYCVYGSHLAHTGERLDIEHPQAWKYGPVFPAAYKKGSLSDSSLCLDCYEYLSNEDPSLASLVYNKTSAMMRTPMVDLNQCHKSKSSPYSRTVKSNSGKCGAQIDDSLIKEFFTSVNKV